MTPQEDAALVSTFYIGNALFGIDTLNVQEVISLGAMTPVHHAPDYIAGIMNLRGQIVTIVDLAKKTEMETERESLNRHIIIVNWRGEYVGLLVDEMGEVFPADLDNLAPSPANIGQAQNRFLKGVFPAGSRLAAVFDINSVLDEEEDEITRPGSG